MWAITTVLFKLQTSAYSMFVSKCKELLKPPLSLPSVFYERPENEIYICGQNYFLRTKFFEIYAAYTPTTKDKDKLKQQRC
jgi:hypothetical protein